VTRSSLHEQDSSYAPPRDDISIITTAAMLKMQLEGTKDDKLWLISVIEGEIVQCK